MQSGGSRVQEIEMKILAQASKLLPYRNADILVCAMQHNPLTMEELDAINKHREKIDGNFRVFIVEDYHDDYSGIMLDIASYE